MYAESLVQYMSRWYHPSTDSYYTVLGIGLCSTNGPNENTERSVIYWSDTMKELKYREISQFLDGRFIPLGPGGGILPQELAT